MSMIKYFVRQLIIIILMMNISSASLKEVFSDYFLMGTIWHGHDIIDPSNHRINPYINREKELSAREFNSITAENCMKPDFTQPEDGVYTFDESDEMVMYAEENGMVIIGHTLVWHNQTPKWFFEDDEGKTVSRDILIHRLKTHIRTVVERYKGRIEYWDVVNELIHTRKINETNYEAFYRNTPWYKIIGPEYIDIAFKTVLEVDPNAKLLYNDYNLDQNAKLDFAINMIKELRTKGIPIYGLGYQGHLLLKEPSLQQIERVFIKCKEANIPLHITELDVSVLPFGWDHRGIIISENTELSQALNPYAEGIPDSIKVALAERDKNIFSLFLRYSDILERVTFWGVWDGNSWRDYSPIRGRNDYPLLFDRDFNKKLAYDEVCKTILETRIKE